MEAHRRKKKANKKYKVNPSTRLGLTFLLAKRINHGETWPQKTNSADYIKQ
jgi:hypothetical protein